VKGKKSFGKSVSIEKCIKYITHWRYVIP